MRQIFLLFFCIFLHIAFANAQDYKIISRKTSDLWIYPGVTMDVVPYGKISSTGGVFVGAEKYFKNFAVNGIITYFMPTEMIKKAGTQYINFEMGGQVHISDNTEERNVAVTIRKEDAGYQKVRIYYYDVPTDRREIYALRGGLISNPYADGVYAGWSYTNMRNVYIESSAFKKGSKASSSYYKFGADLLASYHRSDFYQRFIDNEYSQYDPSALGFRVFAAANYDSGPFENILVSLEFGKRDSWYINMGFSYLINNH